MWKPGMSLADVERIVITDALSACGGNKNEAAKVLGITERTLRNRIHRYSLDQFIRPAGRPRKHAI